MRYFLLLFFLLPLSLEAQKTYNAQKFIAELQKDTNVVYAFQMYRDIDDLEGLRQGFSLEQRRPTGEHRLPIELKGYPYTLYNQWQWTRTQEKINDWLLGKERHYHYNPETKTNEEEIYY